MSLSENRWTNEQLDAITEKSGSLLVAAAAGAGKTAVLVERIIRKITDEKNPVDIDRLLIVTFTNAAATEMRERIAEAISRQLELHPESRLIQRQLALLGKASITTIHAFCMEVIRNNFQSLSIDPDFRITDETESTLMKLEALNELFEEQYEIENNSPFFELLECYGGNRDDQILMDMVLGLYDFVQSSPWPEAWLDEMTEALNVSEEADFSATPWGRVLLKAAGLELEGLAGMLDNAIALIRGEMGLEKYLPVYYEDHAAISELLSLIGHENAASKEDAGSQPVSRWDQVYEALNGIEFATLPRAAKEVDKDRQDQVKKIRDEVKSRLKKLRERIITAPSRELVGDLQALYPRMRCLSSLVKGLSRRYAQKKAKRSLADFNDLEHFCLEVLSVRDENGSMMPSPIALNYRERFCEIMVDEYQDSNLVQEMMINLIAGIGAQKPSVFMVGDVKQSIYRFRQARPELFLQKYNTYSPDKGQPFRKILLFKNFRSRKTVIDAVNFLFKQIMSVNAGELDYTEKEALNPGAVFSEDLEASTTVGGATEFHLIQTGASSIDAADGEGEAKHEESDEDQEEEILDNIQCEARLVARRIASLMKPDEKGCYFAVWDKSQKQYRRVEYRDIVILLRTTRNWAEAFVEELALMGIPSFADTGSGFFKTIEVQVVLSLLQIIDNPLQDIPLLSVLRSPIASFTTDELAELRLAERKGPLYYALEKLAASGSEGASQKAAGFLQQLSRWREMSLYYSTDKLIWRLYSETGYYSMVGAMPSGAQRQANLRILFERARQFENTSYKGLFNFIHFIDKLKSSKGDMGSAKILSENDNVVRIMSIHKSKGLEFPVVILSGCGKKFNLQDMNSSILFHQDLGFGPDVVDHIRRLSWPSSAKLAIREKIRNETLSEEMRILYVALTRAREKLIITGAVSDVGKAVSKWMASAACREDRLRDDEMLKATNYLGWIGPALIRHASFGALRDAAPVGTSFEGTLIPDESEWRLKLWQKSEVQSHKQEDDRDDKAFFTWLDALNPQSDAQEASGKRAIKASSKPLEDQVSLADISGSMDTDKSEKAQIAQEIDRRLSWRYAFEAATGIPAKVSVTELKRRLNTQAQEEGVPLVPAYNLIVKKPLFLEEKKGLSAAERGTILHFVMQHLDLKAIRTALQDGRPGDPAANSEINHALAEEITHQIQAMTRRDLLTRQQAESAAVQKICRFFLSPLGSRMLSSPGICREVPFNMEMSCSELHPTMTGEAGNDETVLLQGVIDCYFEEPHALVLQHYKTDAIPDGQEGLIQERYGLQISCYAKALTLLTGKTVKERVVYLFAKDRTVSL